MTSTTPANGATGVASSATPTATFSRAMDASTITGSSFTLKKSDGTAVAGTVSYDAPSLTAKFTPAAALDPSTTYDARITTDAEGIRRGSPGSRRGVELHDCGSPRASDDVCEDAGRRRDGRVERHSRLGHVLAGDGRDDDHVDVVHASGTRWVDDPGDGRLRLAVAGRDTDPQREAGRIEGLLAAARDLDQGV